MDDPTRFYIGGAWSDPVSSDLADVVDPSTGRGFALAVRRIWTAQPTSVA